LAVAEAAKKNKVSEQSVYSWRKHFNGLEPILGHHPVGDPS